MNFKWRNHRYVHVQAVSLAKIEDEKAVIKQAETYWQNQNLLVGELLQDYQDPDPYNAELLRQGTKVLILAFDDSGNMFVEPLEGQEVMDDGQYVVLPRAILTLYEESPADAVVPVPDTSSGQSLGAIGQPVADGESSSPPPTQPLDILAMDTRHL